MALPSSGLISLNDVRTELKLTGPISLWQTEVRSLAGISSGAISLKDLYGKSNISDVTNKVFLLFWRKCFGWRKKLFYKC